MDIKYILVSIIIGLIVFKLLDGKRSLRGRSYIGLFVCYFILVICYTLIGRQVTGIYKYDFIPFDSYINGNNSVHIILNYIMFIPFGFLLRRFIGLINTVKYGFIFTCIIEITQLVTTRGLFEVDDIIGNTLGTIIGCGLYVMVRSWRRENTRRRVHIVWR